MGNLLTFFKTNDDPSRSKAWLIAILLLASLLRLILLADIPYLVDGNASEFALKGISAWTERVPLFGTGWEKNQNFYFYLHGLPLMLFGQNLFAARILGALGGIFAVLAIYLLAKELFDNRVALFSSFFTAIAPIYLVFSRNGMELIHITYLGPLIVFFMVRGFKQQKILYFLLGGAVLGMSQYMAHIARYFPVLAIATFLVLAITFRKRRSWKAMLYYGTVFAAIALLIYAPMIYFYFKNPDIFWWRFQLEGESGIPDQLLQRIGRSLLVFFLPLTARRYWYYYSSYLEPLAALIFALGIVVSLRTIKKWETWLLIVWFVLGIFLGSVLTRHSPTPNRYLVIFPIVAMVVGVGLDRLSKSSSKLIRAAPVLLFFSSLYAYQFHETTQSFFYIHNIQIATFAGRYIAEEHPDSAIYFIGEEKMQSTSIPTLEFLTKKDATDLMGTIPPSLLDGDGVFVVLPSRSDFFELLRDYDTHAEILRFKNPLGVVLFYLLNGESLSNTDPVGTGSQTKLTCIDTVCLDIDIEDYSIVIP